MRWVTAIQNYLHGHDRIWLFTLCAAVCLVYLPFLGNPFIFDDVHMFMNDAAMVRAAGGFQYALRWLPYASLGWTFALVGDTLSHAYHLGNMLVHMATVIALFYLLRLLVSTVLPETAVSGLAVRGAWFGALLFALHPVAVYAVGYVIQRSILMATLFVLLMQLAYLRALLSGRAGWLVLAVLAYFLAGLSKEHSVMAPALLVAETILLRGQIRISTRALWFAAVAFVMVAVQIVLLSKGVIGIVYEADAPSLFAQQELASGAILQLLSVMTQAGLFFKYLLLMLLPNPAWMAVDMREHFVVSVWLWQGWLGLGGFLLYGAGAFWLLLRPRWLGLIGLALLYPWLLYAPEFSTVRVQEIFVLYRSYLWLPGLLLLIPLLLAKWPDKKLLMGVSLVAVMLVPLAWNRLWTMADNYRLWNDAALLLHSEHEPLAARIYFNRAGAEASAGRWEEAVKDLERTLDTTQRQHTILNQALGAAYMATGRYPLALLQFDQAIALDPRNAKAYFGKGMTLKKMHQEELAQQQIVQSCELKYELACLLKEFSERKK